MRRFTALILAGLAGVALAPMRAAEPATRPAQVAGLPDGLYAEFTTPRGVITCELFYRRAPLMCVNFAGLAEGSLARTKGRAL